VATLAGTVCAGPTTGRRLRDQVTRTLATAAARGTDAERHRNAFERVRAVGDDASHLVIRDRMTDTNEHRAL